MLAFHAERRHKLSIAIPDPPAGGIGGGKKFDADEED